VRRLHASGALPAADEAEELAVSHRAAAIEETSSPNTAIEIILLCARMVMSLTYAMLSQ
jgi:hypothetical protein